MKQQDVSPPPMISLRRGQVLPPSADAEHAYHRVSAGLLAVEARLVNGRRQIFSFHRPGEGFMLSRDMAMPGLQARAIIASEVLRCPSAANPAICRCPLASTGPAPDRAALRNPLMHIAMLGSLTAEERVATFLLEQASSAHHGREAKIFLPMSRQDIADYLGLNPDTLGRVLARVESNGVIAIRGRSDVTIRDFDKLEAISPFAKAMRQSAAGGCAQAC